MLFALFISRQAA